MNGRAFAGLLLAAVALGAAGLGLYQLGARHGAATASSTAPAAEDGTASRKVLYWHDPMVPGQRFEKPGKSPFMDMLLVPVYGDEAPSGGVQVSPAMEQSLGVRTAVVRTAPVATGIRAVGIVSQNERSTAVVQTRTNGYVERLFVRATLDAVSAGQPLAVVYAPEWAGALSEYLALRNTGIEPAILAATRERLRLLSIPDEVVARAERSGDVQSRFTLTAPVAGIVVELNAREGTMAQPGMALFRIVSLGSVWVEAAVPELQVGAVHVGAQATATTDAYPGRKFSGKVVAILPQVDPATRTVRARMEVANPGAVLKPGMFVAVSIDGAQSGSMLVVPQEAVIATGRRNVVVVAGDDGRYRPVDVAIGRPAGSDYEVLSGLTAGQRVVVSGQFLIDSEASLRSVLPRLTAGAADSAAAASAAATYHGAGVVERVGSDQVIVSHGPVPALEWPAKTTGFAPPPEGPPAGLKAGDRVHFEFALQDGQNVLQRIESTAMGAKP